MKKSYFIFPFLFLSLLSCSRGILGDAEYTIGLERREVLFASGKDSIELRTTKGDDWWLSSISTSDTTYINHSVKDIIMEGGGLYVKKTGRKSIFIRVESNKTGMERRFSIVIQAGNYFNSIEIRQKTGD